MKIKKLKIYIVIILILFIIIGSFYFSKDNSEKIPILMYHSIQNEKDESKIIISKERFEEDLKFIKENGFNAISFYELIEYKESKKELPENPIILTFDDGLLSNYTNAFPLLKKYNIKGNMFLIGSRAGVKNYNDVEYWTYYNWDQAREMEKSGLVDINPHSYDLHNYEKNIEHGQGLDRAKKESKENYYKRIKEDTIKANEIFEKELNKKPIIYAYPYGNYNEMTEKILKELGYKVTLTTKSRMADIEKNLFVLKRYNRGKDFRMDKLL